ncbi:MAG TPA: response regulator transcription factor [Thermodesulfobacteriota bacterium]|nr:response regulator transcription factor [Thermodesulfobacteriota bacterium]
MDTARRRKILCVEDEEDIARLLEMIVGSAPDFEPVVTGDVEEAIRLLAEEPALVLIDVGLPDMDGYDLCRVIRQRGYARPILFVSAYASRDDVRRGYEVGGNDYICKPFDPDELVEKIRRWAGQEPEDDGPEAEAEADDRPPAPLR